MTTPELILAIATALTTAVTAWAAVRKANQLTAVLFIKRKSKKKRCICHASLDRQRFCPTQGRRCKLFWQGRAGESD